MLNKDLKIAVFWDYENVPLPRDQPDLFVQALRNFLNQQDIRAAKLYARRATLPNPALALLHTVQHLRVHWVASDGKNAVDNALILSATDTLRSHIEISRILLIAGDGDYRQLARNFRNRSRGIILVYGRSNYDYKVLRAADQAYSRDYLTQHPYDWWNRPLTRPSSYILDFCPKCGNKLDIEWGGKMACRCGYVTSLFDGKF